MSGFKLPSNWETNMQYLAQVGHFLGGAIVIVLATLFSIVCGAADPWLPILVTLGVGLIAAAFKEFYLDLRPPENDSLSDSVMDFSFYVFGAAVALCIALLALYLRARYLTIHA